MGRMKNVDGVDMPLTAEEETQRDKEEAEWAAGSAGREMAEIRQHRDALLRETDHFGLGDVTMSDAMKTYRQSLRDLPSTASPKIENGRLTNVTWPTKPK